MSIGLLEGLSIAEAGAAAPHLRGGNVEYGTVLMEEGEDDGSLAYIGEGQVSVRVGEIELGVAGAGETVGEGALFSAWVRPYTTRAVSPTALVLVDREGYHALHAAGSPVAARLERAALASIVRWVGALDGRIAELAEGRLLHFERAGWMTRVSEWLGGSPGSPVAVDVAEALAGNPNFADAPADALAEVADHLEGARWPANYAILVEGSSADRVHILVEGEVRVIRHTRTGHGEVVATLKPGAVFGMGAALHGEGHGASCVAHGPATTLSLDAATWRELVDSDDAVGSVLRLAAIRALTDAFVYGRAYLLRLDENRRSEIHRMVAPLYEVGTPSEVRPTWHREAPALHIVY